MEDCRDTFISIICPTYNEEKYIEKCINSILAQDYPQNKMEVLFVDGMSNDKTRMILNSYCDKYSFIKILDNPKKIVPCAMNIGIERSVGDIIIRIDAHSHYAPNYFSTLVKYSNELKADNVGAVCITDVLNKSPKTFAIKEVLSNRFGVGNSTFRIGVNEVMSVDTVPFGCWKREVFIKYGLFNEKLVRNQDIELNKRVLRNGGNIYIVPDTYCTYLARETYKEFSKNNYANGKWNIMTVFYTKQFSSLSIRHFIPMLFVLSLIAPTVFALLWGPLLFVSFISLCIYSLALIYISSSLSLEKSISFFYLIASFITLHFSYGFGSLCGVFKLLFLKRK